MEHRIILTNSEAFDLTSKLKIINTVYIKDTYTGEKRIRLDPLGIKEKVYITPVFGVIHKFTSECTLDGIKDIWFEFKWTEKTSRFEIEFEGEIPAQFKNRKNISGWDILTL